MSSSVNIECSSIENGGSTLVTAEVVGPVTAEEFCLELGPNQTISAGTATHVGGGSGAVPFTASGQCQTLTLAAGQKVVWTWLTTVTAPSGQGTSSIFLKNTSGKCGTVCDWVAAGYGPKGSPRVCDRSIPQATTLLDLLMTTLSKEDWYRTLDAIEGTGLSIGDVILGSTSEVTEELLCEALEAVAPGTPVKLIGLNAEGECVSLDYPVTPDPLTASEVCAVIAALAVGAPVDIDPAVGGAFGFLSPDCEKITVTFAPLDMAAVKDAVFSALEKAEEIVISPSAGGSFEIVRPDCTSVLVTIDPTAPDVFISSAVLNNVTDDNGSASITVNLSNGSSFNFDVSSLDDLPSLIQLCEALKSAPAFGVDIDPIDGGSFITFNPVTCQLTTVNVLPINVDSMKAAIFTLITDAGASAWSPETGLIFDAVAADCTHKEISVPQADKLLCESYKHLVDNGILPIQDGGDPAQSGYLVFAMLNDGSWGFIKTPIVTTEPQGFYSESTALAAGANVITHNIGNNSPVSFVAPFPVHVELRDPATGAVINARVTDYMANTVTITTPVAQAARILISEVLNA